MKTAFSKIGSFFLAFLLCVSVSAQDFRTVREGIEYAEVSRNIGEKPVKMNLLRLDLTKVRLDVVHAMDAAIGTETVSSIANRYGAVAAINAGFFRLDRSIFAGDSVGVLMIDNRFLSESANKRVALEIINLKDKTLTFIEKVDATAKIYIKKDSISAGINRERKDDDIVIFTDRFNSTTLTNPDGVEFVVRRNKIRQIFDKQGSIEIPSDGFVISASGKRREELLRLLKIGMKVSHGYANSVALNSSESNMFGASEDAIGGVPQLIKNGKIDITWEEEKTTKAFVETRHPRTAVAKLKDGKFLMITVDGRSDASAGIGLEDLANLLLEFGAVDAMNLDGGGSTTMYLEGKIVNQPSDKEGERKVSDAILVFPRKK
ncbi:MAG: phosphodiester glycosidase family protein [Pyrinomonadaceae bacterium]|nr:phosphodiester glycosidase family protein [Pyrinomonadaceae bacterium]